MKRILLHAAALTGLAALIGSSVPSDMEPPLATGRVYDVSVSGNSARFDLPAGPADAQYLLIVANLSYDTPPRNVTLAAEAAGERARLPLSQVTPPDFQPLSPIIPAPRPAASTSASSKTQRSFWLHVGGGSSRNPAGYQSIVTRLAGESSHLRVYVDRDDTVTRQTIQTIVRLYEDKVRPTTRKYLGLPSDVDGDGKMAIVMTSWLSRLSGGTTALGGMVAPGDFRTDLEPPYSNRADVLYLNAGVQPGAHLETLLAHELAHAVTTSGHLACSSVFAATHEDSWLNEAISHVAENLQSDNWSNLDYRIAKYLAEPAATPLVVPDYAEHGLWRAAATRGSTYLFLRWCVDRYGPGLLSRLIYTSQCGVNNLEAASGAKFAELFRHFAVDLYLNPSHGTQGPGTNDIAKADVYDAVGAYALAGPRTIHWDPGGDAPLQLSLAGTAAQHVLVSSPQEAARRITVSSEAGTDLQITLLRLPFRHGRLRLDLEPDETSNSRLAVTQSTGKPLKITKVLWQSISSLEANTCRQRALAADQLRRYFPTATLPPHRRLVSRPCPFSDMPAGEVAVAVTAKDAAGRRTTAWRTVKVRR